VVAQPGPSETKQQTQNLKRTMKATKILVGIAATIAASVSILIAADTSGILTLSSPGASTGNDFETPNISSKTAPAGIPSTITNGSIGLFTNFNFRVVRESDVTITANYGNAITNATTSNAVLYVQYSPDGRIWATQTPLTVTLANVAGSNSSIRQVTIAGTNFGANAWARLYGITNQSSVGNGSVFPSNVVVNTWRRKQYRE
jgi:hypothetical protein